MKGGRRRRPAKALPADRQAQRLTASFAALRSAFQGDGSASPASVVPERALVFELIDTLDDFATAVTDIGLEWLTEDYIGADREAPDEEDEGAEQDSESADASPKLLYLTMPSSAGVKIMLDMWDRYSDGEEPREGEKEWWKIFGYLSDIRQWDARDRVLAGTQSFLDRRLAEQPGAPVRLEVDLWFRGDPGVRERAREDLEEILAKIEGRLLDFVTIEPIRYQVALVEVPSSEASDIRDRSGVIANADEIMSVRPQGLYRSGPERAVVDGGQSSAASDTGLRPAVAALLDGYPVENHTLLAGRLDVVELDVRGSSVPVHRRYHGTAMASLIIHGDLAAEEAPSDRKLLCVPVLGAPQNLGDERLPEDMLPIGIIYRAVLALKTDTDQDDARGPEVVIINHSICDEEGAFLNRPSIWARLLDWLSNEYDLLFVVSAGNIRSRFPSGFADEVSYKTATDEQRQVALLRAMEAARNSRTLLSPAEAMGVITVGALHLDASGDSPLHVPDPFSPIGVPNLATAIGLGINRSLKPDIVEAGGRQIVGAADTPHGHVIWATETPELGQKTAAPGTFSGSNRATTRSTGTSNAAALVTRAGVRVVDAIEDMLALDGGGAVGFKKALATRTLLVHSTAWGQEAALLESIYPPAGRLRKQREAVTRAIGYGRPTIDKVLDGDRTRITLLAQDVIRSGQLHEYRFPLPPAIIRAPDLRRIVMTLAWNAPWHPTSLAYRGVKLELYDKDRKKKFWNGIKSTRQPHSDDIARGTVSHFVFEGKSRSAFTDRKGLFIAVQASAPSKLFRNDDVPYSLAVTLEVATTVQADIYEHVANVIRPRVRISS